MAATTENIGASEASRSAGRRCQHRPGSASSGTGIRAKKPPVFSKARWSPTWAVHGPTMLIAGEILLAPAQSVGAVKKSATGPHRNLRPTSSRGQAVARRRRVTRTP